MGYRKVSLMEGEFYHVYNRGNSRQRIFFDDNDYRRFIKLLYICNSVKKLDFREDIVEKKIDVWDVDREKTLVSIGAWVLMPNHFHIYIITSPKDGLSGDSKDNNITIFMRKLCTAYSKYINTKYKRTGSLFEGRFKSVHISDDIQAKYLFSYIHLNAVKLIDKNWKINGIKNWTKVKKFLENYKWSSYLDYKKVVRHENNILNIEAFPSYFKNIKDFNTEINDWLM
ncbi:MAG: transposase [Patescibacteria group bacterium]|nr:transposase [Patescibacteria group bacterium]